VYSYISTDVVLVVSHFGVLFTFYIRDGNGSVGHGSNGLPFLDGSHGSWVTARDPLTHGDEKNCAVACKVFFCF